MSDAETVFNTHEETVAAPPERVWALFLDRSRWMESFGRRRLLSGIDGAAGAVAEVEMAAAGAPRRCEETLLWDRARRLVVRITAAGTTMAAHADFRFDAVDGGCRVEVSIHSWIPGSTLAERTQMQSLTQAKIAADFGRLRQVAEHDR